MPALPIFSIHLFFVCDTKARVYPCELFVLTRHSTSEEAYFFCLGLESAHSLGFSHPSMTITSRSSAAQTVLQSDFGLHYRKSQWTVPLRGFLGGRKGMLREAARAVGCAAYCDLRAAQPVVLWQPAFWPASQLVSQPHFLSLELSENVSFVLHSPGWYIKFWRCVCSLHAHMELASYIFEGKPFKTTRGVFLVKRCYGLLK